MKAFSSSSLHVALLTLSLACAGPSGVRTPVGAHAILAAADTSVQWVADSALEGDVDCDGRPDSAFVGRSAKGIHVGLVRAASPSALMVPFRIGGASQDAVCDATARLTVETLDYSPDEDTGSLDGFERSTICSGLALSDGSCDSIHLYWNHRASSLGWWRR